MRRNKRGEVDVFALVCTLVLLVFMTLLLTMGGCMYDKATEGRATFTVTGKDVKHNGSRGKFLIFTEAETFECSDSLAFGVWNSSDTYGKLNVGRTYRAQTCGVRVPFLLWYRNIIRVTDITDTTKVTAEPVAKVTNGIIRLDPNIIDYR